MARKIEHGCSRARVFFDSIRPEPNRTWVPFENADDPPTRELRPQKSGCLPSHASSAVAAKDEELGDIEDIRVVGRWRTARDQHESRDSGLAVNEKWEPALWLRPIELKGPVAEAAIGAELDVGEHRTEVVDVQLEKIGQQLGIRRGCRMEDDSLGLCHAQGYGSPLRLASRSAIRFCPEWGRDWSKGRSAEMNSVGPGSASRPRWRRKSCKTLGHECHVSRAEG